MSIKMALVDYPDSPNRNFSGHLETINPSAAAYCKLNTQLIKENIN